MGNVTGKVALVSGAGRGIGREIALKLARGGASVVVNDLDAEPAIETVAAIEAAGGHALACVGSVSEASFAERFVQTAVDAFGGLDIVINNAGYTWGNVIQRTTDEQWDTIVDLHLKAPFRILRAAQPVIAAAIKAALDEDEPVPCRKVVNISSVAGLSGLAGAANYSAAKAGILGLTKTLAKEWGRYNVTVNAVAFGLITTRLTAALERPSTLSVEGRRIEFGAPRDWVAAAEANIPLGRPGTPVDAAGAVYLLCIPESDYVSGEVLTCGGGLSL
jgi:3-oxoacyl-[acyl-carrier protein] reductase